MIELIRSFLKYIPWELERDMDWAFASRLIVDAEMQGRGIDGALADLLTFADTVFVEPKYRPLAVEILTLLRNALAHRAASPPPVPPAGA